MKAIVHDTYGAPRDVLELRELEMPAPGDGEVLVRVRAASVNAGDPPVVKGVPYVIRPAFGLTRPRTGLRGSDVAGVVEAVGANVSDLRPGDEVFGKGEGAFAEYVLARADRIAPIPSGVTFEQAATLPVAGLTALQGLRDVARVTTGQQVLINGASGGVGTFAVQIARVLGAEVTGVCSPPNVETVRSLGADRVIDYTREDFTTMSTRYDVIFDNAASHSLVETRRALKPKGILIPNHGNLHSRWLASLPRMVAAMVTSPFAGQRARIHAQTWKQADLVTLAGLVATGHVEPVIDRVYTLGETPDALEYIDEGHARGKVVITV